MPISTAIAAVVTAGSPSVLNSSSAVSRIVRACAAFWLVPHGLLPGRRDVARRRGAPLRQRMIEPVERAASRSASAAGLSASAPISRRSGSASAAWSSDQPVAGEDRFQFDGAPSQFGAGAARRVRPGDAVGVAEHVRKEDQRIVARRSNSTMSASGY